MIEHLEQLYEVQKLDKLIAARSDELARLDDGVDLRKQLSALDTELGAEREKLSAVESDLRDTELRLSSTEGERTELRTKLYSGSIISPKELQDVQDKIASLTRLKGDLEERGVLLLDEVEEQSGAVETLTREAEEVRAQAETVETRFREETGRLTARIEELTAERDGAAEPVDDSLLTKYDRIRETHSGVGIVRVDSDLCDGCHTQITAGTLKRLRDPDAFILCDSCNRILYLPASAEEAETDPEAEPDEGDGEPEPEDASDAEQPDQS